MYFIEFYFVQIVDKEKYLFQIQQFSYLKYGSHRRRNQKIKYLLSMPWFHTLLNSPSKFKLNNYYETLLI